MITGASSGLGLVYARELAEKGANLILASRNQGRLDDIARELRNQFKIEVDVIASDLSKVAGAEKLYADIQIRRREVFGLINNAGVGVFGKLGESSLERNQQQILLNVFSLATLSQLYVARMAESGSGFIVNVASLAAYGPAPFMANYAASKSYVLSFTTALWAEYRKSGIRILAVCPGVTDTAFFDVVGARTLAGSNWKRDTPLSVVNDTLRALNNSKPIVIAGSFRNRCLALVSNFVPNSWIARIVTRLHRT